MRIARLVRSVTPFHGRFRRDTGPLYIVTATGWQCCEALDERSEQAALDRRTVHEDRGNHADDTERHRGG